PTIRRMPPGSPRNRRRRHERSVRLRGAALAHGPRMLLAAVGLAALGLGLLRADVWARHSPRFALRSIQISGAQRSSEAELLALGGIQRGMNLWSLDADEAARGMAGHPWVRSVSVRRALPDSLEIRVEEHQAAALAVLGQLYVVDAEGVPFKRVAGTDALDLPLITGIGREEAARSPDESAARLRVALQLIAAWDRAVQRPALSEVHLEEAGYRLVDADGQVVALAAGLPDAALARLIRVRAELRQRGLSASTIHLENRVRPEWVAVQLAGRPVADHPAK
ncbi:MAG TPA: FtsQ-type POTRA domain-containing protein, partial [Myxococcaceae bacterium]|nr:FtsQ-type POTRA domain-containing protein [Myxococcaceae bacterium]